MQEIEQQHAPEVTRRLTQQLIGHKRKSYLHRDETIVAIPNSMKDVLFEPYLRNHDWRWIQDRQTEFADKGFTKPLLKLLELCGPNIQTICDLTVGCGGALLPLLHARPDLRAVAFDHSSQCIKACLHNAGCLNLKSRLTTRCERSETVLHMASDWCVGMLDVPWTSKLKLGRFELIDVVRELFQNGLKRLILTVPYHYDYRQLMECASGMYIFAVGGAKAILLLL